MTGNTPVGIESDIAPLDTRLPETGAERLCDRLFTGPHSGGTEVRHGEMKFFGGADVGHEVAPGAHPRDSSYADDVDADAQELAIYHRAD